MLHSNYKSKTLLLAILFVASVCNAQQWIKVEAGTYSSVALRSDGTLWSMGFNGNGQLGIGNLNSRNQPDFHL